MDHLGVGGAGYTRHGRSPVSAGAVLLHDRDFREPGFEGSSAW